MHQGAIACDINLKNKTKEKMKNESTVIYKLTHELYETAGGKYRTIASNEKEAIDTDLFMRCFQTVEDIFARY